MTANATMPQSEPSISNEDFLKFKEFFYRRTGISFESSKRYFVDKRLVERIEATGTGNFRGYFTFLRFQASGEELQQLTNLMLMLILCAGTVVAQTSDVPKSPYSRAYPVFTHNHNL